MWLILCEADDHPALWAAQALKARGLDPLEIVTPQALVYGLRWEHRLGGEGTRVSIRLHDARVIDSAQTRGALNRLVSLSPALFSHLPAEDRMYALSEMTALFMSALAAMPAPMLNRPTAQGLCGSWRHPSEWALLAARAGLETNPYHQNGHAPFASAAVRGDSTAAFRWSDPTTMTAMRTAFVVGTEVVAPDVPSSVMEGCARLAAQAGQQLLGIELSRGLDGRWIFVNASPRPDLRLGGDRLLDALEGALREAAS